MQIAEMVAPLTEKEETPEYWPEYWPEDMEQAKRWITNLREAYHREAAYTKQLETQLGRQRKVIDIAGYWHNARGIHRTRWMERLKQEIKLMMETSTDADC